MPEGPEVIITAQYLKTKLLKKKVLSVTVISGKYKNINLKGLSLTKNTPLTIDEIDSKGKMLWFKMTDKDDNPVIMTNGFGMGGKWTFNEDKNTRIQFKIKSNTVKNKTYNLNYVDPRNHGNFVFTDSEKDFQKKLNSLAPDILKNEMTDDDLVQMMKAFIKKSKKNKNLIKVFSEEQNNIVSGIGNYLVAEIMYDAKIDPHDNLDDLSDAKLKDLAHSIRKVSKSAYYANTTGYMKNLKKFMTTHAEKINEGVFPNYHPDIVITEPFSFKVYKQKKDPLNNDVSTYESKKGRTIHWVKEVQKSSKKDGGTKTF